MVGNEHINCHNAAEIGTGMVHNIIGKSYDAVSFKRKDKVLPLSAMNSSIKIDSSPVPINRLLLFQRICILKTSEDDMKKYLHYELSPFPLSLFSEEGMRKGTKSSLYSSFKSITEQEFGENHLEVIRRFFSSQSRLGSSHDVRYDMQEICTLHTTEFCYKCHRSL